MNTITNYKDFLEMADAVQLMGFANELNLEFVGKNNSIDALITLLIIFKTISPSKTNQERSEINAILIFLYICKHNEGVLSKDLEKFLSSRQSTISRNLTKLSDPNDIYNKKGRGLVRGIIVFDNNKSGYRTINIEKIIEIRCGDCKIIDSEYKATLDQDKAYTKELDMENFILETLLKNKKTESEVVNGTRSIRISKE
jgi:hypothetical protein